jgi:outer membrane cobalamin receptor
MHCDNNGNIDWHLRNTLLYIVIFVSLPLHGQLSIENDTIKIKEVVISKNKFNSDQAGYKKTTIDSSVLVNYNTRNLSDMISENTGIFIKNYGMGGVATPAFRGTGASHTLVDWNGININSPMLGQSDLSLIPVGLIDDVRIYFGGASMSLNDGGIGGTINLETKPVWKKETLISMNAGIGSFGQYTGLIKAKTGNYKFQTVTKGYFQNSENDFRYLNSDIGSEPVWQKRTNNQVRQQGFIQELYFNNEKNITSARIWYQNTDRNLPASLLTEPNSGEKQLDESLRTMLSYDAFKGSTSFSFTGSWILSRLNYFNRLASIDSRNLSKMLTLRAGLENHLGEYAKLKIVLEEQSNVINSNNYNSRTSRNTTMLTASIDRTKDRFGATILLREILDKNNLLIPDFSSGVQFRIIDEKEYYLKANISRNSRIPSMNDMYWVPGGNPDLKNEYALIYELSYEMNQKISDPLNLKYDLSFFRYNIKDMIEWHPGDYSYWTADNIQNVNSTGAETSVTLDYSFRSFNVSMKAGYSFTKATKGGSKAENDNSIGKQLMYIPENQANALLKIGYKNIYSTWLANFNGKRFISVDNTKYLPGYFINNLVTGIKFTIKDSSIDLNLNIDNVFNIDYQSIAYYPLPGRSYSVKILVQFAK